MDFSEWTQYYGPPLGRPPKQSKQSTAQKRKNRKNAAKRNAVEGKIGQGKRGYGLNDIKARRKDTSESWVSAIIFVVNVEALRVLAGKIFPALFVVLRKLVKFHRIPFFSRLSHQNIKNM